MVLPVVVQGLSDKVTNLPVFVVQTVQTQFFDQFVDMLVGVQRQGDKC